MKNFAYLLLLGFGCLHAQHSVGTSPSPSTLGNVDMNTSGYVDHATGAVNFKVPLTDISAGEFSVPVELFYSSKGFNVENISNWVGLDWNLNAGGFVSRTVLGHPDDLNDSEKGIGILHSPVMQELIDMQYSSEESFLSDKVYSYYDTKKDAQPDIFTLDIMGNHIRFVFDENKQVRTLDNANFKIYHILNALGQITQFNVIDIYGNNYLFDEIEMTTETSTYKSLSLDSHKAEDEIIETTFNSAWYLKKIVTNRNAIILFNYRTETIEYEVKKVELYKICKNNDCDTYKTLSPEFTNVKLSKIKTVSKVIKEITGPDAKVVFNQASSQRQDLKGSYKLNEIIKTSTVSGQLVKFTLNSSTVQSIGTVDPAYPYKNYRLKLNSIYCNDNLKHQFTYNTTPFPDAHSSQQDFWGYYNGNGATSLIPVTYVYPNTNRLTSFYLQNTTAPFVTLPGANRNSVQYYSEAGILTSISNELGNSVDLEYELNKFMYNGVEFTGNGLRVKKVKFREQNGYAYDKNLFYEDDGNKGFVELMPIFSYYSKNRNIRYTYNSGVYQEGPQTRFKLELATSPAVPYPYPFIINDGPSNWSAYDREFYFTMRFSTPINAFSRNSYSAYYQNVRENFGNTNTIYTFIKNTGGEDFPSDPELTTPVIKRVKITGDPLQSPTFFEAQDQYYFDKEFPFVPGYVRSWKPSLPKEVIYNSGSVTRKKEIFEYAIISKTANDKKVYGLKYDFMERPNAMYISFQMAMTIPYVNWAIAFAKYPIFLDTDKKLSKHTVTEYADFQALSIETFFYYNTKNLLARTVTLSSGLIEEKIYKYPHDFYASQTSIVEVDGQWLETTSYNTYASMTNKNELNFPIEIVQSENGQVVSASATIYNFGALTNPQGEYNFATHTEKNKLQLEISQPVMDYQFATASYLNGATFDPRMKIKSTNHRFDNYGNVIEYSEKGGSRTVYIYGYKKKLLIAKIENLNYATIPAATISNLQTLSDQDYDNCSEAGCSEQLLRNALSNLRSTFPAAMVTTYTHDPFIGMTSSADPKGETKYYRYDNLQRLIQVKDLNGNIITEYDYHNKTQN